MIPRLEPRKDSIIVILKGGRLPEWESLSASRKRDCEQEHVDLMLSVARSHGLMHLDIYKLVAPQKNWRYFSIAEFPNLVGAEAWIEAEMAPPYGRYGMQEYYLARRWAPDYFAGWVTSPPASTRFQQDADPHRIPSLDIDRKSAVALLFARALPELADWEPAARDAATQEHVDLMQSVAQQYGLISLEGFSLIAPQPEWHRAWVIEMPTWEGLQAWIEAEIQPPLGRASTGAYYLAHRWAPDYFGAWASAKSRAEDSFEEL